MTEAPSNSLVERVKAQKQLYSQGSLNTPLPGVTATELVRLDNERAEWRFVPKPDMVTLFNAEKQKTYSDVFNENGAPCDTPPGNLMSTNY